MEIITIAVRIFHQSPATRIFGLAIGSKKGSSSAARRPNREKITSNVKNPISPITSTIANLFIVALGSFFFCFPPEIDLK